MNNRVQLEILVKISYPTNKTNLIVSQRNKQQKEPSKYELVFFSTLVIFFGSLQQTFHLYDADHITSVTMNNSLLMSEALQGLGSGGNLAAAYFEE